MVYAFLHVIVNIIGDSKEEPMQTETRACASAVNGGFLACCWGVCRPGGASHHGLFTVNTMEEEGQG